jgi:hypothetical protein
MSQKRKYWIDKLLSGDSGVSSKRVAGVLILVNILVFCYLALFRELVLPQFMFDAICFLCGSLLGITAVENIFNKDKTPPTDETTQ